MDLTRGVYLWKQYLCFGYICLKIINEIKVATNNVSEVREAVKFGKEYVQAKGLLFDLIYGLQIL